MGGLNEQMYSNVKSNWSLVCCNFFFFFQMNSALEKLEQSVSEMIALYAGQEGTYTTVALQSTSTCTCIKTYCIYTF